MSPAAFKLPVNALPALSVISPEIVSEPVALADQEVLTGMLTSSREILAPENRAKELS